MSELRFGRRRRLGSAADERPPLVLAPRALARRARPLLALVQERQLVAVVLDELVAREVLLALREGRSDLAPIAPAVVELGDLLVPRGGGSPSSGSSRGCSSSGCRRCAARGRSWRRGRRSRCSPRSRGRPLRADAGETVPLASAPGGATSTAPEAAVGTASTATLAQTSVRRMRLVMDPSLGRAQ